MHHRSKEKEHQSLDEHNGISSSQINMVKAMMEKVNKIWPGKLLEVV